MALAQYQCQRKNTGYALICDHCQTLKAVLDEVEEEIRGSSWNPYSQEHREDLLYDFERARSDLQQWKAHILRSINQDEGKQDVLKTEDSSSAWIVMDGGHEIFTVEVSRKAMCLVWKKFELAYFHSYFIQCQF